MENGQTNPNEESAPASSASHENALPVVSLPKGGGAVRSIGEKFAANPVTGTGSMSVPILTSPGRSGFGPQLALSYDSGSGNGPFGFGWSLSLPSITRKTDKGLPQYKDADESDVFILSGAEDLVPILNADGTRPHDIPIADYTIRRYRPRIEGLFARIERWTRHDGEVHWRSISKDNILTLYGSNANSRISDPDDDHRVFSWLICETRDDKGNAVLYRYKQEDGIGVNLESCSERNRGSRDDGRRGTNRYVKHIQYGNRLSMLDNTGRRPRFVDPVQVEKADWMFEVVFDYQDHDPDHPRPNDYEAKDAAGDPTLPWLYRQDSFSNYRSGFEVRTSRLCRRVLMFHHFDGEIDVGKDCLVRSTDFIHSQPDSGDLGNSLYTFLQGVTQTGYRRNNGDYEKQSLPPIEFEYTQPRVQSAVEEVDSAGLENLPIGVDGAVYQWIDLHGEGIPGILTEQAGAWFYKRNLSPISKGAVEFGSLEKVVVKPDFALAGGAQFLDLAGDGQPDLVMLDGATPGFYEHNDEEGWESFKPFTSRVNLDMRDPNLKFVDLDGDGHADVLITEDNAFVWHPSLAEAGFGPARRVIQTLDEEKGPRLVFADRTQSIYLADLSGDDLTDLVRIRNGEICYWPNLGYGRFGAKVTMDDTPLFDNPEQFDQRRIRLADIDGSGTTDIIYLHRDGVRLYFNQSGNGWSKAQQLDVAPNVDDLVSIAATDLLGNGTACLVWSSPLPNDVRRPMRYVNLMGKQKPHLLVKTNNNLGAETTVHYAPSTQFYSQDRRDGRPWITRLPFPVHVVERVETFDHISRNHFVTRYAYHHGYFDGEEREFRGFGMVEQFDTEEFAALTSDGLLTAITNVDSASHVPPVHSKTWFHTGAYLQGKKISTQFAAEYFGAPPRGPAFDVWANQHLLDDTIPPDVELTAEEQREACRSLKGAMLRQEIYADDRSPKATVPYRVTEQNFTIKRIQPRGENRHAVFFTHPREAVSYNYERNLNPRVGHTMTLEVDDFGNVLKQVAIAYGRRLPDPSLSLSDDRDKQTTSLVTYTENRVTVALEAFPDDYRAPLPCESSTYELTGYVPSGLGGRFQSSDFVEPDPDSPGRLRHIFLSELAYEQTVIGVKQRRLVELVRTLYRKNILTTLNRLGELESLALPGESYKLAFTSGFLAAVFQRRRADGTVEPLISDQAAILEGQAGDSGGYVLSQTLKTAGVFPNSDGDDCWWIPSGQVFFTDNPSDEAAAEWEQARQHFFLPRRYCDPFGHNATVKFDNHDLLIVETHDALQNRVVVEANDYRVLQPRLVSDPNRNQSDVAFNALGLVVGTAVMGKPLPAPVEGDNLKEFVADLTQTQIDNFQSAADPVQAKALLQNATTRIVYDLHRFNRTRRLHPLDPTKWLPPFAATLARETHFSDQRPLQDLKIQVSFTYSDGFGREIQKKIQAEPGPVIDQGAEVNPRWVGSGWTIYNNKGKPVREFEPFFSATHQFEFNVTVGVSSILFYDPLERVVAALHANHTYEKVIFDTWQQTSYDVNDTVASRNSETGDPRTDTDIRSYVEDYFKIPPADPAHPWLTWYQQRISGGMGDAEAEAAQKAAAHADTPTTAYFDVLGRPFLTVARNRVVCPNHVLDGSEDQFVSRVELDIEGNQRVLRDAIEQNDDLLGRVVMRYDYDMLSNLIHQSSMEAGERWMLNDVMGKPIRAWDSCGFLRCITYDELRRPTELHVTENGVERLAERTVYGESKGDARNHLTRIYQVYDGAGIATTLAYDFKGNPKESQRDLLPNHNQAVDWNSSPSTNAGSFASNVTYDALNRPLTATSPDGSIYRPTFNEANLLNEVHVCLRGEKEQTGALIWTAFIKNINYNARGQRTLVEYQNGATTTYEYDPLSFRLIHLKTTRPPPAVADASEIFVLATVVQDLRYTFDPAGNITRIEDAALKRVAHNNEDVEPVCNYTYDALYRLIEGRGREHIGQITLDLEPPNGDYRDFQFAGHRANPNDLRRLRNFTERYEYDAVGNFKTIQHRATARGNWTRSYDYKEKSLIEDAKQNNQLTQTILGNGMNHVEAYTHDAHGNITSMPHLSQMVWDFKDQLQKVDLGGGGKAYYVYDASGQRVRKVIESQNGVKQNERIYLGGFEIYREYTGVAETVTLERESLHVMDDKQRIALVETQTIKNGNNVANPIPLQRYQFGNHLGSASVELSGDGSLISYEEFHPYGTTAFQVSRNGAEVSLKRYRYTAKEHDEESGLYYHGARYYAPWLGIWASYDKLGQPNSASLFQYSLNNPTVFRDPDGNKPVPSNKTFRYRRFKVTVDPKGAIQVKRGDWLSKYSAAMHGGNTSIVGEYERKIGDKYVPVLDPNKIYAGETLYHRPTRESSEAAVAKPTSAYKPLRDDSYLPADDSNPSEAGFFSENPLIALEIGKVTRGSSNISTNAVRFATRIDLDENEAAEGSQVNAFRHALWQAMITRRFGEEIARKAGYAHEENLPRNLRTRSFPGPDAQARADQTADLLNNVIGRQIATDNPTASPQELAIKTAEYFHVRGLFTATQNPDGSFEVTQTKIGTAAFDRAVGIIRDLNNAGRTSAEQDRIDQEMYSHVME